MGGSASVVQYGGRRRGNKAEENNLLRLYNGSCRDDRRLSEHHLLTSCVEESKVWTMDGHMEQGVAVVTQ